MSRYTVLLDANVLYPAPMRDAFMQLAVTDLFKAKWTADIHREWIEALLRNEPHRDRAALERTRDLMDSATRDCLVTSYEPLIPALGLPDEDARHVLAAAIVGRCDAIVTQNCCCQRRTVVFAVPAAAMMPFVPAATALRSMTGAPVLLLRGVAIRDQRVEPLPVRLGAGDGYVLAHAPDPHAPISTRILSRTRASRSFNQVSGTLALGDMPQSANNGFVIPSARNPAIIHRQGSPPHHRRRRPLPRSRSRSSDPG